MSSIIFSRYHSHCFFLTNVRWRPSLPYGSKSRVQLISPPFSPLRFGVTCSTNGRDDGFCGKGYGDGGVRFSRKEEVTEIADGEELGLRGSFKRSIWQQAKDIAVFAASAGGLWICGPMMSLIDTAVVGQSSSVELAALGPGTVVCDYMSYIFMFLSIATSNMVATSLARKDKDEAQEHISMLLFLALACGFGMLFLMKFFGTQILSDVWLDRFGNDCPHLRDFAVKVLSQTCSATGCERNWSVFEAIHTKKRNRLEHKRLNDLVFVRCNMRLKQRQNKKKTSSSHAAQFDPICLDHFDVLKEWVEEEDNEANALLTEKDVRWINLEGEGPPPQTQGDEDIDFDHDEDYESDDEEDDYLVDDPDY